MHAFTSRRRETRSAIPARLAFFILLAGLTCASTQAATICVEADDIFGLHDALIAAATNGEDDLVELQSGHYSMPSNFFLYYQPATEQHDLTIEGGYTDLAGDPCGTAPTSPDPRQTTLNGGLLYLSMPNGAGSITLKSVTVSNTLGNAQIPVPVAISGWGSSSGEIEIYNSMFIGNASITDRAISLYAGNGTLLIQNSVFASNASLASKNPIRLSSSQTNSSLCLGIVNSTFTANASSVAAVQLETPSCIALAANDIFWGNSNGDVQVLYPAMTYLANDDLGNLDEAANTQASNILSANPLFTAPLNSDFSLNDDSLLRDAGNDGSFLFSPGQFDVIGNPRIYGTHPDVGAYEIQDVIFADSFD